MFFEIIIAVALGCCAGIITGLIPGVHINLVSILLVSASVVLVKYVSPISLGAFIISMAVVHTFLDSIPSVFLGAPDADMVLNVLPGHRLLLKGQGYEAIKLTVIGSLLCLVLTVVLVPLLIPIVPKIYSFVKGYMGWILISVVVFMILRSEKKFWSSFIFFISGILGLIVLNFKTLEQPLLPMLSGLFGVSMLLTSLNNKCVIPKQKITEEIKVPFWDKVKAVLAGTFSGSLTGIFPGIGAAQAAIIGTEIVGNIGEYGFMILVGGCNTVNFVFSLATFFAIDKARNGGVIAVRDIIGKIGVNELVVFLCCALIAGGIATYLAFKITKLFANVFNKLNYKIMCLSVIGFVSLLVFIFSGWLGLVVLIVSTAIGMIPAIKGVGRNMAMGCLLLPVILYFVL